MKRDFLKGLGLSDEAIDSVMAENGRDVQELKALRSELEAAKQELAAARVQAGDLKAAQDEAAKWKAELEAAKADGEARLAALELKNKVREFALGKPFINDITRDAIAAQMEASLSKDSSQDMNAVFESVTKDKADLWKGGSPTPPVVPQLAGSADKSAGDGVLAAFKKLNPGIKLE